MNNLKFNVSLYQDCPEGDENIFKQIDMTRDRLVLYQILKTNELISAEDLKKKLEGNPLRLLLETENSPDVKYARYMDYVSHWILKAAYSENYPSFFIKNELRWFKLRFNNMQHSKKVEFLQTFELTQATEEEKLKFEIKQGNWYKIYFTEVPALLKMRMYPLSKGYILVPEHKMVFWFEEKLRKYLKICVEHCKKMRRSMHSKLEFIINAFELIKPHEYCSFNNFRLSDLKQHVKYFPLCMKFQYENLKKNHHLKHFSRVQFGLFLKGLGLSLEDALEMWKREFTKKMTEKHFLKEYSYFFKHQYGMVGSKIQYTAQCCEAILDQTVGPHDTHGCPFKHWDMILLTKRLREEGMSDSEVEKILSLKRSEQYKGACTKYFKSSYQHAPSAIIDHPITYCQKACDSDKIIDIEDLFISEYESD